MYWVRDLVEGVLYPVETQQQRAIGKTSICFQLRQVCVSPCCEGNVRCVHLKKKIYCLFSTFFCLHFWPVFKLSSFGMLERLCVHLFRVNPGQMAVEGRVKRKTCSNLSNALFPSLFSVYLLCQTAFSFLFFVVSSPAWRSEALVGSQSQRSPS